MKHLRPVQSCGLAQRVHIVISQFGRIAWYLCASATASLVAASVATADDAYISFGGTPHLNSGKDSKISMRKEVIKATVEDNHVLVDCQFVFHNSGPACKIKMGFPDNSTIDQEKPLGGFRTYKSYVNGKAVPVKNEWGKDGAQNIVWHTKTVSFPQGADVRVHDVYTDIGSGAEMKANEFVQFFRYVLHTAASWSGPVGNVDVYVELKDQLPPLKLLSLDAVPDKDYAKCDWSKASKRTVLFSGFSQPTVDGNTIHFHTTNLHATKASDISLVFFRHQAFDPPKAESKPHRKAASVDRGYVGDFDQDQ
jgi:hypothetical protein